MTTVYIDVYFLINFTVDLLAFHLAASFSRLRIKSLRLLLSATLSALLACAMLFVSLSAYASVLVFLSASVVLSYVLVWKISALRRIKLMISFFLFLTIIGGGVYFAFNVIDAYFPEQLATSVHDRRLLTLSVVVLLSIGVIRLLFLLFFHTTTQKTAHLVIRFMGRVAEFDALVDSGNLLKDPIDLTPVMLIKSDAAKKLFPMGVPQGASCDIPHELDRFVRLIPINTGCNRSIRIGYRPERVYLANGNRSEEIKVTFIIDEEGGRFGGYEALVPASALESIK